MPKASIVVEPAALAPAPAPAQLDKPAPLEKSESLVDRIGAKLFGSGGSAAANAEPKAASDQAKAEKGAAGKAAKQAAAAKAAPAAPARRATAPAPASAQLGKPAEWWPL